MIRLHQSAIHERPVFHFFKGLIRRQDSSGYLFEESKHIFAPENLAPVLIEFETNQELTNYVAGTEFLNMQKAVTEHSPKKGTFLLSEIVALDSADLEITYYGASLSTAAVTAITDTFWPLLKLRCKVIQSPTIPELFSSKVFFDKHFLSLRFDLAFVREGQKTLSPRYHNMFSAQRYVDSQVPLVMLSPLLAGSADVK